MSTNIAEKRDIQSITINQFRGVDYSSSMLNIKDSHAVSMKNFIPVNSSLQKRNGFIQISNEKFNGMWKVKHKNHCLTLVHKGTSLYVAEGIENADIGNITYTKVSGSIVLKNEQSWGIYAYDRFYILSNGYYVLKITEENTELSYSMVRVYNDVDTYVPTTMAGITFKGNTLGISTQSYEDTNMLTSKRINTLNTQCGEGITQVANDYSSVVVQRNYYLDSKVNIDSTECSLRIKFVDANGVARDITIQGSAAQGYITFNATKTQLGNATFSILSSYTIASLYPNGYIQFYFDFINPLGDVEDNVTLTFGNQTTDYQDIEHCTFGIMYGAGGYRNRLFLTGNPDIPSVDWHSSRRNIYANDNDVDLRDVQDLTYFSSKDYCEYGTSNGAIVGYQIMGDGSLAVLKEEGTNETTLYFRKGMYETITDSTLGLSYQRETYPLSNGNLGEGGLIGVSRNLNNLNNDILFISSNGVFGMSSTMTSSILNSDYKYAFARSRLINSKLTEMLYKCDNVATIIYDNKYFVCIKKDGKYHTFVADGRYTFKLNDSVDNEYEYEWFVLDNINADQFMVVNNRLYFTNEEGCYLYADREKIYTDYIKYKASQSEIILYKNQDNITIDETHIVDVYLKDDRANMQFYDSTDVYKILNTFTTSSTQYNVEDVILYNEITSEETTLYGYSNGTLRRLYVKINEFDNIVEFYTDEQLTTIYTLRNGTQLLSKVFDYETYEIVKEDSSYYVYDKYGKKVRLTKITTTQATQFNPKVVVYDVENIPSEYVTKAYNCGQSTWHKILRNVTLINDGLEFSSINMGINTKNESIRFNTPITSYINGLDFKDLDLFKVDLESGFPTSFSKDYLLKFNFIQFVFYNNDDSNSIINNMTILYTYGFKTKGVY